uniref:Uncharacterized protein n=1 Tax=Strigamia maritima TaxID=126957 RepID=T1ILI5_STRMM
MSRKSSEPKVHKSQSETPTSDKHKHKPKSKTSSSSQGDSSPKVHKSKSETATVEKKEKSHHDKQKPVASAQAKRKSSTTDKKPQESNQKSIWMNIFSKTPGKKYHDKESQTDTSYAADAERRLSPKVYSKQARRDGQFRLRTKWGPCHPGIAIPIVSVLTLVLRVHPCIVFGIILLLPAGKKEDSDDDFLKKQIPLPTGKSDIPEAKADPKSTFAPNELPYVVAFGAPILFIQAIALVIVCGLLFAAILKESPKLILPYIAVQIFTLILWLLLSLIAVCSEVTEESKDLSGLILISGLGAVFDLWAVMTIITSYMDIKGFSSPWDEESPPPEQIKPRIRESPTKRLVEPRRSSRHNTSHLTSPNYPAATSHPRRKRSPKPEPYMDTFWQNMNVAEKPDTARLPGSRHRKNSPSSRYPSPPGSRRYRPANTPTEVRTKYAPTAL